MLRMLEAIEKARKSLTADKETNINIDYLLEEQDLIRTLKREEFEKLIDDKLRRFTEVLQEAVSISKVNVDDLEFVELVGDATRIPVI